MEILKTIGKCLIMTYLAVCGLGIYFLTMIFIAFVNAYIHFKLFSWGF